MLKSKFRLTQNYDFQKIRKRGQRIFGPFFSVSWLANNLFYSRFGFIATTKIGKSVKRHRAVRLLRESIRLIFEKIKPGFDVVFVAGDKIVGKNFDEVDEEVKKMLKRAKLYPCDTIHL